jgi:hypothetical protein
MAFVAISLAALSAISALCYLHAYYCFGRILLTERPELFPQRSGWSYFLSPGELNNRRAASAIIEAAFGSIPGELNNAKAITYARRIRLGVFIGLSAFVLGAVLTISRAA